MQWFPLPFCMIVFRHTVGLLWTSDQPVAETSLPAQDNTTYRHNRQTSIPSAGFEPATPATKRPQTYALDRAATEVSRYLLQAYKSKRHVISTHLIIMSFILITLQPIESPKHLPARSERGAPNISRFRFCQQQTVPGFYFAPLQVMLPASQVAIIVLLSEPSPPIT
jgi:hypothetical protein